MSTQFYQTTLPGNGHWSLHMRRGSELTMTDLEGGANVGMVFFNPELLMERYNAPDTLKCQHTFKLQRGNCLYSDMGRVFASIVHDDLGWHDTVCGNMNSAQVLERWGERNYQEQRNDWLQNGNDAFLVELAKYGLSARDLPANINWFSKVASDDAGKIQLDSSASKAGQQLSLRFEMDTLVVLHTCPHPLNRSETYPRKPVQFELGRAKPVSADDYCMNFRPENRRGFANNALYYNEALPTGEL
ncbi:urea amidolyase associated protein UAAP1 [Marinimicrobium sp. ABcell2]|uniref:urea amidolyase associated protein UAAP1 n=1 Tax=Marinimicrobium sp. ABcell2 TaxID=3069751 RepID=UPI0027B2A154|nr:urea amidolyase associated protein UAAP1 [Marinimicrobium sp. ABcell2]MDQ2076308.1 urea carboxylase-associated family protein [Marinimicrobium sp. ABcell2]